MALSEADSICVYQCATHLYAGLYPGNRCLIIDDFSEHSNHSVTLWSTYAYGLLFALGLLGAYSTYVHSP